MTIVIFYSYGRKKKIPKLLFLATGARFTELPPPTLNFLFTYLFSIKCLFLYYFISFFLILPEIKKFY